MFINLKHKCFHDLVCYAFSDLQINALKNIKTKNVYQVYMFLYLHTVCVGQFGYQMSGIMQNVHTIVLHPIACRYHDAFCAYSISISDSYMLYWVHMFMSAWIHVQGWKYRVHTCINEGASACCNNKQVDFTYINGTTVT